MEGWVGMVCGVSSRAKIHTNHIGMPSLMTNYTPLFLVFQVGEKKGRG